MADRTDTADARHQRRHLVERPPFAEFLESAKLGDVETRIGDLPVFGELYGDFRVAFNAGHRIDNDFSSGHNVFAYAPKRGFTAGMGRAPGQQIRHRPENQIGRGRTAGQKTSTGTTSWIGTECSRAPE